MEALVGTNCLDDGGDRYPVVEYVAHRKYKIGEHGHDIALVRVKDKIKFNDHVKSIKYSSEEFPNGVEALLTGWGRIEVSISLCNTNYFQKKLNKTFQNYSKIRRQHV